MSREIRRLFRATYGVPYALQAVNGQLWVAANCQAALRRPARSSDAQQGEGAILEVDSASGHTLRRWPVPGRGGVHGMQYDPYEKEHGVDHDAQIANSQQGARLRLDFAARHSSAL